MTAMVDALPVFGLELRSVGTDSPRRARAWLGWVLELARVPQDTIDTALLAASELVTNAVVHTDAARILVSVELVDAGVRLVVHDDAAPVADWQAEVDFLSEHGRGLILVRALAEQLDIDRHQHGTTITALLPNVAV
jgi:anti-sigma regulatory factor (Ser/Thr protein kinase)